VSDFLRYCELVIGPLADWQGKGNTGDAVRIIADGTNAHLRVSFNASKTLTGEPNKIDITVYNLSRNTRQAIRTNLSKIQLFAGYESSASSGAMVASGGLLSAVSMRQGSDIVTKLTALDGYGGMVRGAYSRSFSGQTPINQVVKQLAAALPGVTVGKIDVDGRLPPKGMAFVGTTTSQLNKLADQQGFSWSVQDGVFQAVSDKRDTGNGFIFTSNSNLISCAPLLNGPLQVKVGVEIVAKFDARMKPGDRMVVKSTVSPELSGDYKSTKVDLSFDSHGPAQLKAQSLKMF